MKVSELMQKRTELFNKTQKFVDEHANENGVLSGDDKTTYENMEQEIINMSEAIDRQKRAEAMEREFNKPVDMPIVDKPTTDPVVNKPTITNPLATMEYKNAVLDALRNRGNIPFLSNYLKEGVDASGGYLVPDEMDKEIIKKLTETNIFRKFAKVIQTSGEYKFNMAGNLPAAGWVEEGEAITFADATFAQISLMASKLVVAIKVSEELLADNAFDLEGYLIDEFSKAIGNAEEDAFLNGNGTHKPHGIFNATDGGEVAHTCDTTSIKFDDIFSLIYSLKRPYRKNAKFITNDQTIAILRKVKDNNGAYIWQPSVQAGEPDRILGYPVFTSPYCPIPAAGACVMAFGDYSYYKIAENGHRSFQELKELYAGNGLVAFVSKERVDGKLTLREAVKIMKIKDSESASGSGSGASGS